MGTWNETCGLSSLPIEEGGTQAVLVPLIKGTYHDTGCSGFSYPTGLWQPLMLPFYGVYDGCGTLERPTCVDLDLAKRVFGQIGHPWTKSTLKDLERGEMVGRLHFREPGPIGQVLIRRDIWDFTLTMLPEDRKAGLEDATHWVDYVVNAPKDVLGSYEAEVHFDAEQAWVYFHLRAPASLLTGS
jgi:hypothetical protein